MLSIPTLCSGILGFFLLCSQILVSPFTSIAGTPIHGARQAGMATAFTAIADDPSTIVMNPAGITQLKNDTLYSGVTVISASTTIDTHSVLRAGYAFIKSRVPAETLSPSFPDTDSHSFGWQNGHYSLDTFHMVQFFENSTVSAPGRIFLIAGED